MRNLLGHSAETCDVCADPKDRPSLILNRPLCMHVFCHNCLLTWLKNGDHSCPTCRERVSCAPIRDNAFELRLYDAIADGEVSSPAGGATEEVPYTWAGIVFESLG